MVGENFEELAAGGNDVLVAGCCSVAIDQLEHDLRAPWVIRLGTREFSGGPNQSEDLAVLPIEVDEIKHQLGTGRRDFGGFLETGLKVGGFVSRSPEALDAQHQQNHELAEKCFQNPAFLSASTILLASGAISLSG